MSDIDNYLLGRTKRWLKNSLHKLGFHRISDYIESVGWLNFLTHAIASFFLGEFVYNLFYLICVMIYSFVEEFKLILEDLVTLQFLAVLRIFLVVFYFLIVWYRFFVSTRIEREYYCIKDMKFIQQLENDSHIEENSPSLIFDYQIGDSDYPFLFRDTMSNEWTTEKKAFEFLAFTPIWFVSLFLTFVAIFVDYENKYETFILSFLMILIIFSFCCKIEYDVIKNAIIVPNINQKNWKSLWSDLSFLLLIVSEQKFNIPLELVQSEFSRETTKILKENMKKEHPKFTISNVNEKKLLKLYFIFLRINFYIDVINRFLKNNDEVIFKEYLQGKIEHIENQIVNQHFDDPRTLIDIYNELQKDFRLISINNKNPALVKSYFPLINTKKSQKEKISLYAIEIHEKIKSEPNWVFSRSLLSLFSKSPLIFAICGVIAIFFSEIIVLNIPTIFVDFFLWIINLIEELFGLE